MQPWTCLCGSLDLKLIEQTQTLKTWRCDACSTRFTIERADPNWRLYLEDSLLASDLAEIAACFGREREADVVEFFNSAVIEVTGGKSAQTPRPIGEKKGAPEPEGQPEPDLAFLKSLGSNIPRRYAHLVSPEDLQRESKIYWPSTARHLLADTIPDARTFSPDVAKYIDELAVLLGLEPAALDFSVSSAEIVDTAIEQDRPSWLSGERFLGLVAYAGETIRAHVGGSWVAEYNASVQWWEPFIRGARGKLHNPWLNLYKGILAEEEGSFSISVAIEIQRSPGWRSVAGGW